MSTSKHGSERSRKRLGIPKKSVERNMDRVIKLGKSKEFYSGNLLRYLMKVESGERTNERILVYGSNLYLLGGNRLITTWPIPSHLLAKKPGREYEYQNEEVCDPD